MHSEVIDYPDSECIDVIFFLPLFIDLEFGVFSHMLSQFIMIPLKIFTI
jgi:hypothetical protein